MLRLSTTSALALIAATQFAAAGTDPFFVPLTQSAAVAQGPDHVNELTAPWRAPAGITSKNLTSLHEIEADPAQSVVRVPGLEEPANAAMFDMSAFDASGRYIFTPHEVMYGAGLSRYDMETDTNVVLFKGDMGGKDGNWMADFGALDPATLTPKNTLIVAEEWSGEGRAFEVDNLLAEPGSQTVTELTAIPNVSIEGLRFSKDGKAIYFVDEDRSGSIYKFVPTTAGDYSAGQSFVLVVEDFTGDVTAEAPKFPDHNPAAKSGAARWVALTDAAGKAQTTADPFDNASRGGRAAADELGGTPFRRPEDVEVGTLANGHEVVYFTATEELAVYAVEILDETNATVRLAADENTLKNLGFDATTGHVDSPDNLAQDANGNIYIVEDWPNGGDVGGDVWFLRDTNGDGVAESLDHFLSNQVKGSESTGMIFNPANPSQFIINIQHPESTTVEGGQGDATWLFDISGAIHK